MYHAAPITYTEGAALLGSDVVIMEKWDPEEFLRLVEQEKICSTFLVPTHFVRLLQLPEETRARYDLSSLKFICHGAAPVSKEVKRRMIDWLGPVLFEFYGGTEGGGISISSQEWLDHPGSVGKPRPDLTVTIMDDDGKPCATGAAGDIYFQANENRFEYKDDPQKTAAAYRDDKYTLGDIGYLDEDGYLYLCDRKADTIISGGVNIFPAEIEAVLQEHPAVKDCCVVGINDDEWGETVLGAIQLLADAGDIDAISRDIEQHCRQRLASYQVPRQWVFEETLPRTETGKIKRREMRDRYRALKDTHPGGKK
jgi:long-chain acyl-CoA synthetase